MTEKTSEKGGLFIKVKYIKHYSKKLSKIICVLIIGFLLIASLIALRYKPLYKVTLNGKVIGYIEDKEKMKEKMKEFEESAEGNITSIKITSMPEFELELVSGVKESETKEKEVLALIEEQAEIKCKTYAIKLDGNEKANVNTKEEAENLINEIKTETTEGVELNFEIEEQEKDKKEVDATLTTSEIAKAEINKDVEIKVQEFEKKKAEEEAAAKAKAEAEAAKSRAVEVSSRSATSSRGASIPATGASFMRPVTGGTITSPYGRRNSGFHTGLDIASSTGTPIYASASGTVKFAGTQGGYGKLVIIDHGNGYQTYYAHCSALYVSAGQTVKQGENISAMGSTGNSTGPHVHFEIRYNGNTLNPQNYI